MIKTLALAALFAVTVSVAARAAASTAATAAAAGLRGAERPASGAAPAGQSKRPDTYASASLEPDLSTSPRTGGLSARSGGAACRQACAQELYLCSASREDSECSPAWTKCVVACPDASPASD